MATWKQIIEANKLIKTQPIKGKQYAEVNQRIKAFRSIYPDGAIITELISDENGICKFKASVYDEEGKILATGHAYEKEDSTFINKTSYIENCVPLNSMILTKDGWKFYYQLKLGEEVLTYNMSTKKMEYSKLLNVNIHKDRPLLELKTSRFCVKCTPQHKWIAKTQYKTETKIATEELTNSWKIIQAVRQEAIPSILGRKLGWLMCDCDMVLNGEMASTGYISQSKHIQDIKELFGEGRLTKKYNDDWLDNYEWIVSAEEVRKILGAFGMANYKDLPKAMANADINDVMGCYNSMMLADGTKQSFSSTYRELVDAIQIMCARLGIATTFITSRMCQKSTKPVYTIGIKKTDGAYFSEMEIKNLPPQDVWCPTTENGTWVMKQGDFVTLTSNCETSAIGRALGMIGLGIDVSIASKEEVENAINNQENKKEKAKEEPTVNENDSPIDELKAKIIYDQLKEAQVTVEAFCEKFKIKKVEDLMTSKYLKAMNVLDETIKNRRKK